jgi:hypothetical protein
MLAETTRNRWASSRRRRGSPTDADCLDYLEWLRWPEGFACPTCGHSARLATWRQTVHVLRVWRKNVRDGGHDL